MLNINDRTNVHANNHRNRKKGTKIESRNVLIKLLKYYCYKSVVYARSIACIKREKRQKFYCKKNSISNVSQFISTYVSSQS